jgi:hypothetical protein
VCGRRERLNATCAATSDAGWTTIYGSSDRFFPGDTPRPVAPELLLRGFELHGGWHLKGRGDDDDRGHGRGAKRITHVQLVALHNQCTGNRAFQGEQTTTRLT